MRAAERVLSIIKYKLTLIKKNYQELEKKQWSRLLAWLTKWQEVQIKKTKDDLNWFHYHYPRCWLVMVCTWAIGKMNKLMWVEDEKLKTNDP